MHVVLHGEVVHGARVIKVIEGEGFKGLVVLHTGDRGQVDRGLCLLVADRVVILPGRRSVRSLIGPRSS